MKDDKFDNMFAEEVFFFALKDRYELYFDFLLMDQVHTGLDFFQHVLDHQSELIHFLAREGNSRNFAWLIVNPNQNSAPFGVEKGDNGL